MELGTSDFVEGVAMVWKTVSMVMVSLFMRGPRVARLEGRETKEPKGPWFGELPVSEYDDEDIGAYIGPLPSESSTASRFAA